MKRLSKFDIENIFNTCHDTAKQGWVFPSFSPDSDDRLSLNFHRFFILYIISCDTRSVDLGQYCLPKVYNGFKKFGDRMNWWTYFGLLWENRNDQIKLQLILVGSRNGIVKYFLDLWMLDWILSLVKLKWHGLLLAFWKWRVFFLYTTFTIHRTSLSVTRNHKIY